CAREVGYDYDEGYAMDYW
nr:immunoglobulin heavy chain junction region [Mus musculus]